MTVVQRALAAALVAFSFTAAAGADERAFAPKRLETLEVSGGVRLEAGAGEARSATLSGDPDVLKEVTVRETAAGLSVRRHCTFACGSHRPAVLLRVTSPELATLRLARGVEAEVAGLNAPRVVIAATQGVDLTASGQCGDLVLDGSMGAEVDAKDLHCRTARVSGSMGADLTIFASERAETHAAMGAQIDVRGSPPELDSHAAFGGSVARN